MKFRLAEAADAPKLLEIYRPYVEKTAITFEYEAPSSAEFSRRIQTISATFPYIVAVENDKIVGYAYASRYRERRAYDWVVELSIYVTENEQGKHIGSELYRRLFALLKKQNYQRAYACITSPNPKSHQFHENFGFHEIGVMEQSGYKFGKWYGIEWMDLKLQDSDKVAKVKKITDLTDFEINEILAN